MASDNIKLESMIHPHDSPETPHRHLAGEVPSETRSPGFISLADNTTKKINNYPEHSQFSQRKENETQFEKITAQ